MVKSDRSWPCPQHVARQLPHLNCFRTSPEPRLPVYQNSSTCTFPACHAFPGFTVPAIPIPKTEQTDEGQGFLQYPNSQLCLKETHTGGVMQNADPSSLQKRLLIFDHSDTKTRLFYCPVFPFDRSPVSAAKKFTQACHDVNEGKEINMDQSCSIKYYLPEEYDEYHTVTEESEMHEDTEEINALLYSDDDGDDYIDEDDEVTSTGHYPLPTERISPIQEHSEYMEEEIASSDRPLKRQKLNNGGYGRSSSTDRVSSVRLNETCEYASDAESNYVSDRMFFAGKTIQEVNSMAGDIQMKKDKIRESLRVLENLIPGAKGKQPLSFIDGTIEYLKSQTGALGVKYH